MNAPITSSVLMSVYERVSEDELRSSLGSLQNQTRAADEIVIVIDGPVPEPIQSLLERFASHSKTPVKLLPTPKNQGLVAALNHGFKQCTGDWIIRMDADDISLAHRFEQQLGFLESNLNIDVLGSSMLEFDADPSRPDRIKPCRTGHHNILSAMAFRNPINHPTVCIRRSQLIAMDGYPQLPLLEDYFLWAKLSLAGAVFENLDEPLYLFRFDDSTLERRGGYSNFKNEVWLRRWMHQQKLISTLQLGIATTMQLALRLTPLVLRRLVWHKSRQSVQQTVAVPTQFEE